MLCAFMRNNIWDVELNRPNPFHTLSSLASLSSLSGYLPEFFQGRWQGRKILSSLKLTQWTPFFERVKYCYRNVKYAYRRVSGRGCKVPFDTLYMLFYCNSTLFYIILNLSACPDAKKGTVGHLSWPYHIRQGKEVTTMMTWALFFTCGSFIVGLLRLFLATLVSRAIHLILYLNIAP